MLKSTQTYPPLPVFKVTFDDGDVTITSMAANVTLEEAQKYYIGQRFEISETRFHTAVSVTQVA